MSWGVDLWDQYDNISAYTNKAIDYLDVFAAFFRQRCAIELEYAAKIRRLTKNFVPKKTKDEDEYQFTYTKAFLTMLSETNDVAGQHEVIAENLGTNVANNLTDAVKNLKEQRKKCLIEGSKLITKLIDQEELLHKCKKNYEKSFKEAIKAQQNYDKANLNYDISRAELDRQRVNAQTKSKLCEDAKSHYALRLRDYNDTKRAHYTNYLPTVLQRLQDGESDRIQNYGDFIRAYSQTCKAVLPILATCYDNVTQSADQINADMDNRLVIEEFKSGFPIPEDEPFIDLADPTTYPTDNNTQKIGRLGLNDSTDSASLHHQYVNSNNPDTSGRDITSPGSLHGKQRCSNGSLNILNNGHGNNLRHGHPNGSTRPPMLHSNASHASLHANSSINQRNTNNPPLARNANFAAKTHSATNIATFKNTLSGGKSGTKNGATNKKRNLFNLFTGGALGNTKDDFCDLPPNQRRKKIIAKIDVLNTQLAQEKAARDAMLRMREVYDKNPTMGDPRSIDGQLGENTQKLSKLNSEFNKLQAILHDIEAQMSCVSGAPQNLSHSHQHSTNNNNNVPFSGGPPPHPPPPSNYNHNNNNNLNSNINNNNNNQNYASSSATSTLSSSNHSTGPPTNMANISNISNNNNNNNNNTNQNIVQMANKQSHLSQGINKMPIPLPVNAHESGGGPPRSGSRLDQPSPKTANNLNGANNQNYALELDLRDEYDAIADDAVANDETNEEAFFTVLGNCVALYDFDGSSEGSIPMKIGHHFEVIELDQGDGWTRVRRVVTNSFHDCKETHLDPTSLNGVDNNSKNSIDGDEEQGWIEGFVPTTYVKITLLTNDILNEPTRSESTELTY